MYVVRKEGTDRQMDKGANIKDNLIELFQET